MKFYLHWRRTYKLLLYILKGRDDIFSLSKINCLLQILVSHVYHNTTPPAGKKGACLMSFSILTISVKNYELHLQNGVGEEGGKVLHLKVYNILKWLYLKKKGLSGLHSTSPYFLINIEQKRLNFFSFVCNFSLFNTEMSLDLKWIQCLDRKKKSLSNFRHGNCFLFLCS